LALWRGPTLDGTAGAAATVWGVVAAVSEASSACAASSDDGAATDACAAAAAVWVNGAALTGAEAKDVGAAGVAITDAGNADVGLATCIQAGARVAPWPAGSEAEAAEAGAVEASGADVWITLIAPETTAAPDSARSKG